jgi:hypothetical protein
MFRYASYASGFLPLMLNSRRPSEFSPDMLSKCHVKRFSLVLCLYVPSMDKICSKAKHR